MARCHRRRSSAVPGSRTSGRWPMQTGFSWMNRSGGFEKRNAWPFRRLSISWNFFRLAVVRRWGACSVRGLAPSWGVRCFPGEPVGPLRSVSVNHPRGLWRAECPFPNEYSIPSGPGRRAFKSFLIKMNCKRRQGESGERLFAERPWVKTEPSSLLALSCRDNR